MSPTAADSATSPQGAETSEVGDAVEGKVGGENKDERSRFYAAGQLRALRSGDLPNSVFRVMLFFRPLCSAQFLRHATSIGIVSNAPSPG